MFFNVLQQKNPLIEQVGKLNNTHAQYLFEGIIEQLGQPGPPWREKNSGEVKCDFSSLFPAVQMCQLPGTGCKF